MKQDKPSMTAQRMALARAAHQVLDTPLVLTDPIAMALVGPEDLAEIRMRSHAFNTGLRLSLRAFAVARSRIVEDELAQAVSRGVRQLVILGAGMDTFAYRNPYGPQGLQVFEVDHPDTQAMKRQQLQTAGIPMPVDLRFVPVNFETDSLGEQLRAAGFQTGQPTLVSWLGVSMYLEREVVQNVLHYVQHATAPGSAIVFDYIEPLSGAALIPQLKLRVLAGLLALKGEPWRSYFEPGELADWLRVIGFQHTHDLAAAQINARYFDGRSDQLKVDGMGHVMLART